MNIEIKHNKNQEIDWTYWFVFHFFLWAIYAGAYLNTLLFRDVPSNYWVYVISNVTIASVICVGLKFCYSRIKNKEFWLKIIFGFVLCVAAAIVWHLCKSVVFNWLFEAVLPKMPALSYSQIKHLMNPLMLWSVLFFLYDYHKQINQNKIQTLQAQALANENKLKLLSYQLNPHFLFNVLNSIGSLVLKHDDMKLYNTITKLSDFLRYTLESQPWKKVSLNQELECTNQYLEIQQVRFKDKISIDYDIDSELLEFEVPSLILLPLIENTIKHTIAKSSPSVQLSFSIKKQNDQIVIIIKNTKSMDENHHADTLGIGINNVKERLHAYYGDQAELMFFNQENDFEARMKLPIS